MAEGSKSAQAMADRKGKVLDSIDYEILGCLLKDCRMTFKQLAKMVGADERKVARRVERLVRLGVIKGFRTEVDWSKLGYGMSAIIGTRTAVDEKVRRELFRFFAKHPRIVQVESTVGSYEYVFRTISKDLKDLRDNVCTPLEPLTAGLSTSIVSSTIKEEDYSSLLRLAAADASGGMRRSK